MPLDVAIIGAGLGGLGAAVALRRQGHNVTVFERYDFAGEVGASLSAASNGSRFLEEWGVDVRAAKPVILKKLIMHDWCSGKVENEYGLGDYKTRFRTVWQFLRSALCLLIQHGDALVCADGAGRTIITSTASTSTSNSCARHSRRKAKAHHAPSKSITR